MLSHQSSTDSHHTFLLNWGKPLHRRQSKSLLVMALGSEVAVVVALVLALVALVLAPVAELAQVLAMVLVMAMATVLGQVSGLETALGCHLPKPGRLTYTTHQVHSMIHHR